MPIRRVMGLILKQYPRLEELTWELRNDGDYTWRPSDVNEAFRPLHSHLVKLEMSILTTDASEFNNCGDGQMDFSNLTSLKSIKIYDRVMFARKEYENAPLDCYRNCHKRLPISLVKFEVRLQIREMICIS
jgi:hypothetical protein